MGGDASLADSPSVSCPNRRRDRAHHQLARSLAEQRRPRISADNREATEKGGVGAFTLSSAGKTHYGQHGHSGISEPRDRRYDQLSTINGIVASATMFIYVLAGSDTIDGAGMSGQLFIDAEHQGPVWWVEVKANDIANLGDEQRISRELEGLAAMRLQRECLPNAVHAGETDRPEACAIDEKCRSRHWIALSHCCPCALGKSSGVPTTTNDMGQPRCSPRWT